ncbi:rhodoquinone biosynthesis methyltransferase RquA [Chitinilyticum piscinae]|uniref:Class I SAM-dependent methyltransferase n=1 Tax=Chitinilyticum piscinae TaxID=2866724 RepID=A0A8J7FHD2_9NEIS|nr:rhodoquinone biosynthesis methyltransferase RquA [Chitinilyticum piscinae]MBE9609468.1 class I SAM-dependent methyltransferase [Chitinilyticum piscinae]
MTRNHPELKENPYYEGVPEYMTEVYDWAYVDPNWVKFLDRNLVVTTLLFGNDQRLMRSYLAEIEPGMRVWQVAHVYGDLVARAADKVGPGGSFHLTDITPIQIEHGSAKLRSKYWARVMRADAAVWRAPEEAPYDLICSFFLLHEVPEDKKAAIVNNILDQLPVHGKAVFVDYSRPHALHPVGWILRVVNALLEPFAKTLWQREISSYARDAGRFSWEKQTFFGGVYQRVVVTHSK